MRVSFDLDEQMVIESETPIENMALARWSDKNISAGTSIPMIIIKYDGKTKLSEQGKR